MLHNHFAGWMPPASFLFVFALYGINTDAARIARKSRGANGSWHDASPSEAKSTGDRIQSVGDDLGVSHFSVSPVKEAHNVAVEHEAVSEVWNKFALLEKYSRMANTLEPKAIHVIPLACLAIVLCLMVSASLCGKQPNIEEQSEHEDNDPVTKATEIRFEELVRRLSQTIIKPPVGKIAGSLHGKESKKMHISVWWGAHVHTWASTRLGWWESQRDHTKRVQPLNSIYLKDVSEVVLTHTADSKCEPGVCIKYEGRGGQEDKLLLFFESDQLATQYVEDLKTMIKRVKKADAMEKDQSRSWTSVSSRR